MALKEEFASVWLGEPRLKPCLAATGRWGIYDRRHGNLVTVQDENGEQGFQTEQEAAAFLRDPDERRWMDRVPAVPLQRCE
ncbi:MAG: hypothetical protein ACRD2E_01015 [Terriglobales bacterium]